MKGITDEELNSLINEGLYICKRYNYDKVSASLFQRTMVIDGMKATIVFGELQRIGVIVNARCDPDDEDFFIGDIDKEKLKEFSAN